MTVGLAILAKGEKEVVVQYLDLVARFWASEENALTGDAKEENEALARENKFLIERWKLEIKEGRLPQHKMWD